ncbi:hypothetical protein TRFO_25402 [Tritrichomonas foetus]|uniref:Cilium assembly protein DZIP1 N-terminal domain-containing protein n=1 Tax=Tritrichomonas foetus TaxID=1144522 RepID=A0A1J4K503_9EUKA|nr:hypothetical protein TRFO_25402 [Tritrichomonas foetus]|eukprot:OHT06521.1 hypothetical protein TRFO_25402 [Tritrichomonas foetus]
MKSFFPPPAPILQPQAGFIQQQPITLQNQSGMMLQPGMSPQLVGQPNAMPQINGGMPGIQQVPNIQQPFQTPMIPQITPQANQQFSQIPFQSAASGISNPPAIVQQSPYPPPPVVVQHPAPTKERYAWAQRTEKMKWGVAESIDIDQIVRRGDLNSVLFYMDQFLNATITKDDLKQFGSKGALNAFLILQLGADYLMNQKSRLEAEMASQKPNNEQVNANLIAQYNYNIDLASKNIQQRDEQIAVLKRQVAQMKQERKQHKSLLQKYHKKFAQLKGKKPSKKKETHNIIESEDEPGALHDETALQELKIIDQHLNSVNPRKQQNQKSFEISDSISEGEINTAAIGNHIEPFIEEEDDYSDGEISGNSDGDEEEETSFGLSSSQHSDEEENDDEY